MLPLLLLLLLPLYYWALLNYHYNCYLPTYITQGAQNTTCTLHHTVAQWKSQLTLTVYLHTYFSHRNSHYYLLLRSTYQRLTYISRVERDVSSSNAGLREQAAEVASGEITAPIPELVCVRTSYNVFSALNTVMIALIMSMASILLLSPVSYPCFTASYLKSSQTMVPPSSAVGVKLEFQTFNSMSFRRKFTSPCLYMSYSSPLESTPCNTVYVSGISTKLQPTEIAAHFGQVGRVMNVSIPMNPHTNQRHGYALVAFENSQSAERATQLLHRSKLGKKPIQVRLDAPKREEERKKARLKLSALREIERANEKMDKAFYTAKSIILTRGMVEYRFPSGKYLTELLRLFHSDNLPLKYQSLFDILMGSKPRFDVKHAKGLTETIAMVYAFKRVLQLASTGALAGCMDIQDYLREKDARLFAVADGVAPYTAAAFNLLVPNQWQAYSIDPMMNYDNSLLECELRSRLHLIKKRTDDFVIPPKSNNNQLSIIVACHSHCILQEFWNRVPTPKIAIVMPCCNEAWSELNEMPIDVYNDYEVQSPRRKILLYYRYD